MNVAHAQACFRLSGVGIPAKRGCWICVFMQTRTSVSAARSFSSLHPLDAKSGGHVEA